MLLHWFSGIVGLLHERTVVGMVFSPKRACLA